jgi:Family of unknown function (DUF5989)
MPPPPDHPPARRARRHGLVSDLWHLIKTTKKWWLVPILLAVAILALFVLLGSTSVAPFIYSIF